ncbi:MAG: DEAD/DEAH box helicase family protein [Armatimonadetes bacterium]|nr:DEAD/DEAH box helicase family protein [Armatimonadota bacterium]
MGLHPEFPHSPYVIVPPEHRWFPADEELRQNSMDKLMPPLVPEIRKAVHKWRESGYVGASPTSKALLTWWFLEPHLMPQAHGPDAEFQYFFSQREAIESVIYLTEVVGVKDKFDMMRFDSSGAVSAGLFKESWRRYVIKMATGSGKTKVLSLALAWSFFHRLYEPDSEMARNFLIIAPNIIVLDRLYKDFKGLDIFLRTDPVLPDNGYEGRDWRSDFQLKLHVQDEVRVTHPTGNIFLTNIHRVYAGDETLPTADDEDTTAYFLGDKPVANTTDTKVDLGMIVRDIDELAVFNDEAHHVHDERMAWFKSIEDIHNRMLQKGGKLALQLDVTATPKHNNGGIFVQTISDYPLVEAIYQDVVKHPVLPDAASRAKLHEKQSAKFTEKYSDYLNLGVLEWRKAYEEHQKVGKKAVLFVMTDDTRNCDDVAEHLESMYPDLKDAVLVIHTKNNGEISESTSGKAKEELERLRKLANEIDQPTSPYNAIVSVLMLKEGWDVRNVTTIVGLRAYNSTARILPEQTLGRGLRKMYSGDVEEQLSVVGTDAFMDFVDGIQAEGVVLDHKPMGHGTAPKAPIVVEVDHESPTKDIAKLDIDIPVLSPRNYREYKNLAHLDTAKIAHQKVAYLQFSEEEQRVIVFKDIVTNEITHLTELDGATVTDPGAVIGYFTQSIMKSLRLISGYDVLYGKVKQFVRDELFDVTVKLESGNTIRNLSELAASKTLIEGFCKAINALTISDKGDAEIRATIKLGSMRPFVAKDQRYYVPKKSVVNRIIGDSHFELEFARFLDDCADVEAFGKNFLAVNFKLDYVNASGNLTNYYPDFFVRTTEGEIVIVETKGVEDLDVPAKMTRLKLWCEDVRKADPSLLISFIFVESKEFDKLALKSFKQLKSAFKNYQ